MRTTIRSIALLVLGALAALLLVPAAANAATPVLTLSVSIGPPTTATTASGTGYPGKDAITVTFDGTSVATATTGGNGKFSVAFVVPSTAIPGAHAVSAFDPAGVGASATFTVRTNWSGSRFDMQGSASNPYENVLSPANVPGLTQTGSPQWGAFLFSEPIYAGGEVYAASDDGTVRAFNPSTGQQTWSFVMSGPGPTSSPLAVQVGPGPQQCAIVAASVNGTLYGLDPVSGRQTWSMAGPGPTQASPVALPPVSRKVHGHLLTEIPIVVSFADGSVERLDGCAGTVDWVTVGPGPSTTPAVLPGVILPDGTTHTIIVEAGPGPAQALDSATGAVLWSQIPPDPCTPPYAFGSGTSGRIVLGSGSQVLELDASTGVMLWSTDTGATVQGGVAIQTMLAPAGGSPLPTAVERLFGGNAAGDVTALDPSTGVIDWVTVGPGPIGTPAVGNGVVYVEIGPGPQSEGVLQALDASTGAPLFSADLGAIGPGPQQSPSPAVADGRVFAGDFTGGLRIFGL